MSLLKAHRSIVNIVIFGISSYFILNKSTGWCCSQLLEKVIKEPCLGWMLALFNWFIIYCLIARVIMYVKDQFTVIDGHVSLPAPLLNCLFKCNIEIDKHLKELFGGRFNLSSIEQKHNYEDNLQFLHISLVEHLVSALKKKHKMSMDDIFVSVFHDPSFSSDINNIKVYQYVSHYDPSIYNTETEELSLENRETLKFAGIRALLQNKHIICTSTGRGQYVVGSCERRKSIKHYIGIPLNVMKRPVALLNIEFHNKSVFEDAKGMKKFIRNEIQAFIYLYEYQLHKKYFFTHLKERMEA